MNNDFIVLSDLIKKRRSIGPEFYEKGELSKDIIQQILENACYAPTHKRTQPWRFKIFMNSGLVTLSEYLSEEYKRTTPPELFSEIKYIKAGEKPKLSACVIALCLERSPASVIPEWEETAALACAVQNIWLSCTSLNLGSYWSSPGSIKNLGSIIPLGPQEECLGFFYMGWSKMTPLAFKRKTVEEVCFWVGN